MVRIQLPAYSALFRGMKGLVLLREGHSYRVYRIEKTSLSRDLNVKRLKRLIFTEIKIMFNRRIYEYTLTFPPIEDKEIGNLELSEIIVNVEQEREGEHHSGVFELYPMAFVCDTCGDFRLLDKIELESFKTNKCLIENCTGKYHQLSIVRFCRECGKIEPFKYWCKEDTGRDKSERYKEHPVRLIRPSRDTLYGWGFECRTCSEKRGKKPKDIFSFECDHTANFGGQIRKISNKEKKRFDPLTIREGSVFLPVVKTFVNVEPIIDETEDLSEIGGDDYWLTVGYYLGRFNQVVGEISFKELRDRIKSYKSLEKQLPPETLEVLKRDLKINEIFEVLEDLRRNTVYSSNKNVDEFLTVKGITIAGDSDDDLYGREVKSFEDYLANEVRDEKRRARLRKEFNRVKSELNIHEVTYIPEIKLVSTYVGVIKGPYTRERAPHFEPLWNEKTLREGKQFEVAGRGFEAYIYPYSTEGILVELNPYDVTQWLYDIGYTKMQASSREEALERLMFLNESIEEDKEIMDTVFSLLHTLSHAFILNSSKYSGLDVDSFGEILFPAAASFLIYSTSVINIGGLQYLFENSLIDILEDIKEHIRECIYDPVCISEEGACFACMYLPEYVCGYFNKSLDRRLYMASDGRRGFWDGAV